MAVITVILAVGMSRLSSDVSSDRMFAEKDPVLVAYHKFQRQFGQDDIVIAAVSSDSIFTGEFMTKLRDFHQELEQTVPWLEDITSLSNADWMVADTSGLKVGELGHEWPAAGALDKAIKDDVINNPLYKDLLLSADGKMTLLVLRAAAFVSPEMASVTQAGLDTLPKANSGKTFKEKLIGWHDQLHKQNKDKVHGLQELAPELTNEDFFEAEDILTEKPVISADDDPKGLSNAQLNVFLESIKRSVEKHQSADFTIRLAGGPVVDQAHIQAIHTDLFTLIALALLMVIVVLSILLRTFLSVLIPVLVIVLSVLGTLGLMGYLGMPISIVSQALPTLLLTMGVLDCVHLLGIYYLAKSQGRSIEDAIKNTFERAGVAVFYTSLTTAAGFISFSISRLQPISEFGWMAAFGIALAMFFSFLLLPSLLTLYDKSSVHNNYIVRWDKFAVFLAPLSNFGAKKHYAVLLGV
ncbi:MAG: MMPL family transporter, partial [Cellvibrionaceae bacterium]|nr:MMPL family transporter [Cellvibrionaceae bacterium]